VAANSPVKLVYAMDVLGAIRSCGTLTEKDTENKDILSQAFELAEVADGENYGTCDGAAVYCAVTKSENYGGMFTEHPCTFYETDSGGITMKKATEPTNICLLESKYEDKNDLYKSAEYTNLFNELIMAEYNRRNP
jgi:hypothetical protein